MLCKNYDISEIRLYGLGGDELNTEDKIREYFTKTLCSEERKVGEKFCYFNDLKNKIKAAPIPMDRLLLFSFKNKIYAHAVMHDDGRRVQRENDKNYPVSYLFYKDSICFFKNPISCDEWQTIWDKRANQAAVILEKDLTTEVGLLNCEKYKNLVKAQKKSSCNEN